MKIIANALLSGGVFILGFVLNYYFLARYDDRNNLDARMFWSLLVGFGLSLICYGILY